jgi:hypothetical protein
MGILDFLSDLSKASKKDELGLGGMRSLLGTRGAAPQGKRGDEMMSRTSSDSLPGYFDPETREYVPWYIDLFDGGGLNAAGSVAEQEAAQSMAATGAMLGGAPTAQPGLLQTGLGSQLSDMERANRNRVGVDPRNLGGTEGYGPMPARDPRNLGGAEGYGPMGQARAPKTGMTGIPGYTLPQNPAARVSPQSIPASGGNMAINTPAARNRDQMIADQQMSNMEQAMRNHPLYPEYVDFLNRSNMPSTLSLFQQYVNMFGRN